MAVREHVGPLGLLLPDARDIVASTPHSCQPTRRCRQQSTAPRTYTEYLRFPRLERSDEGPTDPLHGTCDVSLLSVEYIVINKPATHSVGRIEQRDEIAMTDKSPAYRTRGESDSRLALIECIEQHMESLLGTISLYARRVELDADTDKYTLAVDILQETVIEALEHSDRFTTTRQPLAWLRGIAVNVVWRKKVAQAKHAHREISLGRLSVGQPSCGSEQDALDRLVPMSENVSNLGLELESEEEVAGILSLLSPSDQEIVRLAILEDYERDRLARHLGISVGTARMRLHRALRRLQSAWVSQQAQSRRREAHG